MYIIIIVVVTGDKSFRSFHGMPSKQVNTVRLSEAGGSKTTRPQIWFSKQEEALHSIFQPSDARHSAQEEATMTIAPTIRRGTVHANVFAAVQKQRPNMGTSVMHHNSAAPHKALEYSAVVWGPHQQRDIDKLEDVQRRAARSIKQYRSRQPGTITKMLKDLNLPSLQDRRRKKRLVFLYKIADTCEKQEAD